MHRLYVSRQLGIGQILCSLYQLILYVMYFDILDDRWGWRVPRWVGHCLSVLYSPTTLSVTCQRRRRGGDVACTWCCNVCRQQHEQQHCSSQQPSSPASLSADVRRHHCMQS